MSHSLAHVEGQGDVLILGEEEDQEVVTGLALLNRWIQADLIKTSNKAVEPQVTKQYRTLGINNLCLLKAQAGVRHPRGFCSPQRTSVSDLCGAAGRAGEPWYRGSCSQRSCHAGVER